jgi:endonuclease YncB( thermonuclease family)
MGKKWAIAGFLGLLIFGAGHFSAAAGKALYGKVIEVKSEDLVVLDYGTGQYLVRIVGIVAPKDGPIATKAKQFVSNLVLGKHASMRFESRAENGEMVSRLFTADPRIGIKDVGVELVRAGLARRRPNYDYKYGELSKAENEARSAKRGVWAAARAG